MPHEYVSNHRVTTTGARVEIIKDDEDQYVLKIADWGYGGPIVKYVKLSRDDIKAVYLMLDDVVRTI